MVDFLYGKCWQVYHTHSHTWICLFNAWTKNKYCLNWWLDGSLPSQKIKNHPRKNKHTYSTVEGIYPLFLWEKSWWTWPSSKFEPFVLKLTHLKFKGQALMAAFWAATCKDAWIHDASGSATFKLGNVSSNGPNQKKHKTSLVESSTITYTLLNFLWFAVAINNQIGGVMMSWHLTSAKPTF